MVKVTLHDYANKQHKLANEDTPQRAYTPCRVPVKFRESKRPNMKQIDCCRGAPLAPSSTVDW